MIDICINDYINHYPIKIDNINNINKFNNLDNTNNNIKNNKIIKKL